MTLSNERCIKSLTCTSTIHSMLKYKVLLLTSGTGSRLGEITQKKNKALIEVGGRPVIEYILQSYPPHTPFVVTLGYKAYQVKDYLDRKHSNRQVEYVYIDRYEGPGTSCGYSVLQTRKLLQQPFIFHPCDTLVFEKIPEPTANWTAGYVNTHIPESVVANNFTTQSVLDDRLIKINPLGAKKYDYVHMGLDGVWDYKVFWQSLTKLHGADPLNSKLTDIHVINQMTELKSEFKVIPYSVWLDTGNLDTLLRTQAEITKYTSHVS